MLHLVRHPEDEPGHITVHNSETFQQFGEQQLSQPGSKSKLSSRTFIDMKPEEVKERKEKVGKVKTLAGIMSKYHYVCFPDRKVMWRLFPCSCPACMTLKWTECEMTGLVGAMMTVVQAGSSLYS